MRAQRVNKILVGGHDFWGWWGANCGKPWGPTISILYFLRISQKRISLKMLKRENIKLLSIPICNWENKSKCCSVHLEISIIWYYIILSFELFWYTKHQSSLLAGTGQKVPCGGGGGWRCVNLLGFDQAEEKSKGRAQIYICKKKFTMG